MRVRLDQVNIVVRDMEAMAAFYERLGLEVGSSPPEWAPHHRSAGPGDPHEGPRPGGIDLDLDSERFARVWNEGWPGGAGVVLGFRVPTRDDVDRRYEDLTAAGYEGQQEPYDAFWGARYAVVSDPDGNSVGLMSPADDARRTPSPPPPP
jgi:catechol 2,3-dioxygenase-like lactoylglutathione lyase family enzyme